MLSHSLSPTKNRGAQAFHLLARGALCIVCLFTVAGCAPTLDLEDFENLPQQQPLHRYSIAHRGSIHRGYPDNSIPALQESISQGVTFLEVDVRKGSDGALFIFHDGSLKEGNFSSPKELTGRKVQELTAAERASVRLDSRDTVHIPTLKEALDVVSQSKSATLQIDLKGESDELLQAVIDLLKQEGKLSRALIQLKSPERIQRVRVHHPRVRILARCKDASQLDQAIAARVEFVELERWMSADAVRKAHEANIGVVLNVAAPAYDKEKTWSFFRSKGVDSIMTDHAEMAQQ